MRNGKPWPCLFVHAGRAAALCSFFLGDAVQAGGTELGASELVSATSNPDEGLPIGGWLVYTSFFAGAVFNDNVRNSSMSKQSATGLRLRPSVTATLDLGIHKATAYALADGQIYPGSHGSFWDLGNSTPASNVQARLGFSHLYQPFSDLTIGLGFDYTRQLGLFGLGLDGDRLSSVFVPSGVVATGAPRYTNQLTGVVSVQKELSNAFVTIQSRVQGVLYDSRSFTPTPFVRANPFTQPNGVNFTTSARLGYWVGPSVYAFVEPGGSFQRYETFQSDGNGYRIVSGLGTDQIGLFKGEVYGGYQSLASAHGYFSEISSPAYGGRIDYSPTPYLTISGSADKTLGSTAPYSVNQRGVSALDPLSLLARPVTVAKAFQSRLSAQYSFSPYWTANVRGGYGETRYANSPRVDTAWTAGAGASYTFWRNVALTLDYQFSRINSANANAFSPFISDAWFGNYSQSVITAGITYKY